MYATVRRYEGIDKVRSEEITRKVGDGLLPSLRELPGFGGYYLIDAAGCSKIIPDLSIGSWIFT